MVEHLGTRRVLTMDELAELKDQRPRARRRSCKLPGDKRGRRTASTSSRSTGRCDGNRLTAASSLASASWSRPRRASTIDAGIKIEVGGGRAGSVPKQPDLATDPKLKAMLQHVIGGKPWQG
jgi:hypothetical protein